MTNQPAFPAPAGVAHITTQGLTMLDYFAAKVLPTVMAELWEQSHKERSSYTQPVQEIAAAFAYDVADAMMAERVKRGL